MAKPTKKRWSDYLWIVSATYFTLGYFNIVFAWLGVICFLIPLLMAIFGGGKGYCNNYCGRGQLFLQIGNTLKWSRKKVAPRWLSSKWFRNGFLVFFMFFFIQMIILTMNVAARNHTPALDFRCALALGLPHCSRAMGGAIRFRSLRHHAHLAHRGRYPHGSLPSSHMVRVLPNGQYDSNNLQT